MDLMSLLSQVGAWLPAIISLIAIEAILSIDNAAVLAAMVKNLTPSQQKKALRWGLGGAYVLRGGCLLVAGWLMTMPWLKIIGGVYLLWLVYKHFTSEEEEETGKTLTGAGLFLLILQIEWVDLTFSIDNVFAAVAISSNIYVVMAGCFIGILAMRFASGIFVKLLNKYPSLGNMVFYIITLLGLRLILDGSFVYVPQLSFLSNILHHEYTDLAFSGIILGMFMLPILFKRKEVQSAY